MQKLTKQDKINLLIINLLFLAIAIFITKGTCLYGSTTDWVSQHSIIPDYFRQLFLENHDLFPDFALNIGGGQNIYNLSYYGLLSPIILISYLLPFIKMSTFIMVSSIIVVIISNILLYKWLKNKNYSSIICLISTIIFTCATCLTFHSHRHIMFINYMPFLILGLYGVDKKLNSDRGNLLTISVLLMILTSYYYSVCGIITLVLYGIYVYLKKNSIIKFKKFIIDGLNFLIPILIGIAISGILIIPTFLVILNNRLATTTSITISELLIPFPNLDYFMYDAYGIGLTSISILAIINFVVKKDKANRFLGIIFILLLLFPLVNYLLNATMYIDSKALIPLLPLLILIISELLKNILSKEINIKVIIPIYMIIIIIGLLKNDLYYLCLIDMFLTILIIFIYYKTSKKLLFIIPTAIIAIASGLIGSLSDTLVDKEKYYQNKEEVSELVNYITNNDDSFYRISNQNISDQDYNLVYNLNYYNSTIYSSTSNQLYSEFYFDIMNNNVSHRNRLITSSTKNLLFLLYTNNKYLISNNSLYGYELLKASEYGRNIYVNNNTLPLGYARSNIMNINDFEQIPYPYNTEVLLNNIISSSETNSDFVSNIKKTKIDFDLLKYQELNAQEKDNYYLLEIEKETSIEIPLTKEQQNSILFISINILESDDKDLLIYINDNLNKLTKEGWKYHNLNYTFNYTISSDKNNLIVKFSPGTYKISLNDSYLLNPAYLENITNDIDVFEVNKEATKGDIISGNINVTKDGYFSLNIPYDKGFIIKVDNKEVDYEKINASFIGFPINKGMHDITIEYQAPGKKIGLLLSAFGIVSLIIMNEIERKKLY